MPDDQNRQPRQMWAIVELYGHNKIAGLVTDDTWGGAAFLRVDVPATSTQAGFTKFYGPGAIYCMTPVSEALARLAAESMRPRPVEEWELPRRPELPADGGDDEEDET